MSLTYYRVGSAAHLNLTSESAQLHCATSAVVEFLLQDYLSQIFDTHPPLPPLGEALTSEHRVALGNSGASKSTPILDGLV